MSISEFIPTLFSTLLNKELEKALVMGSCTNSLYEGEISKAGDRVKISEISDITINNYTANATLTYENIEDAAQYLTIDQIKSFSFKVDDIIKIQSNAELLKPAMEKAAYTIADTMDQYIAGLYAQAGIVTNLGTHTIPLEINKANVAKTLVLVARSLDDKNVPRDGRFIVIPPFMVEDLVNASIVATTSDYKIQENGLVGRYAGLDIKVSNNLVNTAGTKYKCLAGYNGAIAFAKQAANVEAIRLETTFADGVRGLFLYGAKVVKSDALACLQVNEAAD